MAELGDAADSKSAVLQRAWGFESPSRHFNDYAATKEGKVAGHGRKLCRVLPI